MAEIKFEIKKHIGVLSEGSKGWTKELNVVNWDANKNDVYDIRKWSPDHTKMSKGISLSEDELQALKELLDKEVI